MRQLITPTFCEKRRKQVTITSQDFKNIRVIQRLTKIHNKDNISRTRAYLLFYQLHPEISWALLASMVSRNAGWNMTDLWNQQYLSQLSKKFRMVLFHTYERPNWLIFQDAYPQLLIYALSLKHGKPMFYLLKFFGVSIFIEAEWERYWWSRDGSRLYKAQIVNEQQVIEGPVLNNTFLFEKIFDTFLFFAQECFKVNAVIFPNMEGKLFGFYVKHFQDVDQRIVLGKQLHKLLFEEKQSESIQRFANTAAITGSRYDYEQFINRGKSISNLGLRDCVNMIKHRRLNPKDWFTGVIKGHWFAAPCAMKRTELKYYQCKRSIYNKLSSYVMGVEKNDNL